VINLDCTFRDGGYYNHWDFSEKLTADYFEAMMSANIDVVEIGFRSLTASGFNGPYAYSSDTFLDSLNIPQGLKISVMVNASEFIIDGTFNSEILYKLFPRNAANSKVDIIRIACHFNEFKIATQCLKWLKERGFFVCFNVMQISDRSREDVESLSLEASKHAIDVLYFADSLGAMTPNKIGEIISWLRSHWQGNLGVHTHDNMGLALQNTLRAIDDGVLWADSTVTGMGRGPGNARTEDLVIEAAARKKIEPNLVSLMALIKNHFRPMQHHYGWGTNPFYYLAGKFEIHPSYIQEMLNDARYDETDILAVISHLRKEGGKKFNFNALDSAKIFYHDKPVGNWSPKNIFSGREVLILGAGPGAQKHRVSLENYIRRSKPLVVALNTQKAVASELIDLRVACHPIRLLADCEEYKNLTQSLITPYSMLPNDIKDALDQNKILDFGITIQKDIFKFSDTHCVIPNSLVLSYALAIASSGQANKLLMAGFDGYGADDPRDSEIQEILDLYQANKSALPILAITPTRYLMPKGSVYALI